MADQGEDRNANIVLTADVDAYNRSMQQASQQTTGLSDQIDALSKSLDKLAKSSGTKMQLFGAGTAAGIVGVTAAYASFEKQMSNLQATAAVTNRSFGAMEQSVNKLRSAFPVSTSAAAELIKTLEGLKDGTASVNTLAETFTRLGAATGESTGALTTGLLSLQRQMGTTQRDTAKYANTLTELSQKNGVAATSILDFSSAIAPIGRIAGMTQTEIMGVSTAFTKAGQDGYAAGNAFNKMLTDIMQATQSGSPDLAKYANLIGMTVDQFQKMDKTSAITQIFTELNRLGPNAISVLNRMGLDGMRTMKAITGVTQQTGGIAKQVAEARSAFGDTSADNALGRGSQAAVGGLSDALTRLGSSSKQIAENLGANFAPVATKFVDGMNAMASAAANLASGPLGKVASVLAAITASAGVVGGTLLKLAGPLATMAAGYALTRNAFTGGIQDVRKSRISDNDRFLGVAGEVSPYLTAKDENRMGPVRSAMYSAGRAVGGVLPAHGAGSGQSILSRVAGLPLHLAAGGLNFLGTGYDPLQHPFDPTNRDQIIQGGGIRNAVGAFAAANQGALGAGANQMSAARQGMSAAWSGLFSGQGGTTQAAAGASSLSKAFSGVGSGAAALTKSFVGFNVGLAKASAGLAVLATRATASAAASGLRGIGSTLLAGVGGPVGLAVMGGMAAYSLNQYTKSQTNMQGVGEGATGFVDTYRTAVGAATTATYDFAQALKEATKTATPPTAAEAFKATATDLGIATSKDYTNQSIGQLGDAGIQNLLQSSLTGKESPEAIQSIKLDLLKRYQDVNKVNQMLTDAQKNQGKFDFNAYLGEQANLGGHGYQDMFKLPADNPKYYEQMNVEMKNRAARAGTTAGTQGFQEQTLADFNAMIQGMANALPTMERPEAQAQKSYLQNNYFGGGNMGKSIQDQMLDPGDFSKANPKALEDVWRAALAVTDEKAKKGFDEFLGRAGLNRDQVTKILAGQVAGGLDKNDLLQTDASFNLSQLDAKTLTGPELTQQRIRGTKAGGAALALPEVQAAIAPGGQGNVNAQLQAVDAMTAKFRSMGMSTADVQKALLDLKAEINDTSDPLYQLASAAQQASKDMQNFQLPFQGPGTQYQAYAQNFQATIAANTGPEGEQERKQALLDIQQQTVTAANAFKQQVIQQREFTIQRQQAQTDFDTQRSRGERNFNLQQTRQQQQYDLQRSRSEQDYTLSKSRNEADYQTQLQRGLDAYNLSVSRTMEDYNTSRSRNDADFALSRQRNEESFNRSMKDSYADFVTSKLRNEQDFNHQVTLMVQDAAKQMMNIYDRVTVQRTWSAASLLQNAQDQNQRASEQAANLDKARSMGLSSDTIKQLGLTDSANAQQLARLVSDMATDPTLVKQFNQTIADRLKAGGDLVKDQDNTAWTEMNRQYQLSLDRAQSDFEKSRQRSIRDYQIQLKQQGDDYAKAQQRGAEDLQKMLKRGQADYSLAIKLGQEDFGKAMSRAETDYNTTMQRGAADYNLAIKQQVHDFNVSMSDMTADFDLQMQRSQDSFDRMAGDMSMSLEEILTQATTKLRGNLAKEAKLMLDAWKSISAEVLKQSGALHTAVDQQWGFANLPNDGVHGPKRNQGTGGGSAATEAPVPNAPETPIAGGHVTTPFGKKGSMWASGYHTGDDYSAPTGTAIHAALGGKVMSTQWGGAYGNLTKIAVGPGLETWYAHQSSYGVKPGQVVQEGDVIGKVGATGNTTGPHLHFEVRQNGVPVNPSVLGQMMAAGNLGQIMTLQDKYAFEAMIAADPQLSKIFQSGQISSYLNAKVEAALAAQLASPTTGNPGDGAPTNVSGNQKIVKDAAAARGWGAVDEWNSLYQLVMHESGFKNTAQNPTSTAYGMFQFLDSTWAGVGGRKTSDPNLQAQYGLKYIAQAYGDPNAAWNFWRNHHWYGDGSLFTSPQTIGVGERGPEAVIPLNDTGVDFIASLMTRINPEAKRGNTKGGSVPVVHNNYLQKVDASTNYHGAITVVANDPNKFAEELRLKKRRRALTAAALGGK